MTAETVIDAGGDGDGAEDGDGGGDGGGGVHLAGGDGMSGSQRELVSIMQQVKTKELTVQEAETFFYDWKQRHERGCSRSFRQKQVIMMLLLLLQVSYFGSLFNTVSTAVFCRSLTLLIAISGVITAVC